ncbi:MAG: hypothetical protein ABIQ40_20640 [Bacteroidia bacterium]
MRFLTFILFIVISNQLFGQREIHGNSTPWSVFAGYIQPIGKWTHEVEFKGENSGGNFGYSYAFSGQTGLHAKTGFTAGITYDKTFLRKTGKSGRFELLYPPLVFNGVMYDLKSADPAVISSKIKPLLIFETAIAPVYRVAVGSGTIKVFFRTGFSFKTTSGKVQYERTNFEQPHYSPVYTGNDRYLDRTEYSYSGIGVAIGPGIQFNFGRFGIGSEFHSEFSSGKYKGHTTYKDYFGNEVNPNQQDLKSTVFFDKFINVYLSYSFGFGR